MTSAVASGSSKVNSNQPQSRSHKKREASSDEPLEFTSHEVKSLSTSRMTKSRLQDQVQDDWKKGRDRKNHANMFLSALIDSETSSAAPLSLTNAIDNQPCPSWDFALTDGYVRAESVPPSNLDDLEGCGCRDECDPKNCNCFQKHIKLAPDTWKACKDIKQDLWVSLRLPLGRSSLHADSSHFFRSFVLSSSSRTAPTTGTDAYEPRF